jgi:hypothetical protein
MTINPKTQKEWTQAELDKNYKIVMAAVALVKARGGNTSMVCEMKRALREVEKEFESEPVGKLLF